MASVNKGFQLTGTFWQRLHFRRGMLWKVGCITPKLKKSIVNTVVLITLVLSQLIIQSQQVVLTDTKEEIIRLQGKVDRAEAQTKRCLQGGDAGYTYRGNTKVHVVCAPAYNLVTGTD